MLASEFAPLLVKIKHGGVLAGYYRNWRYWLLIAFMTATAAILAYFSYLPGLTVIAYFWFGVSFQAVVNRVLAGGQPTELPSR